MDSYPSTTTPFRRPLIPLVLAYSIGLFTGPSLPFPPVHLLLATVVVLGAGALALWASRPVAATISILVAFLLFGCLRYLHAIHPQERFHLSKVPNAMLTGRVGLEGVIISPPEVIPPGGGWRRESRIRFLVRVEELTVGEHPFQVSGGARVSILDPVQDYRYGDRIRGNFRLRRPRGYWNPGAFYLWFGLGLCALRASGGMTQWGAKIMLTCINGLWQ